MDIHWRITLTTGLAILVCWAGYSLCSAIIDRAKKDKWEKTEHASIVAAFIFILVGFVSILAFLANLFHLIWTFNNLQ